MTRAAALLAFALALPAPGQEDDAALAKGQKYLDKVAGIWAAKLPQKQLCGVYLGRQWAGAITMTLKASEQSGAAYELTANGDLKIAGKTMSIESRSLYARNLSPLSSETTETSDDGAEKRTLSVANGAWKLKTDKAGSVSEKEGKVTPGTTVEAIFLPIFALPDDAEHTLQSIESKKGACRFKKLAGKKDRFVDGRKQACGVIEVGHPSEAPDHWYLKPDGTLLELQAGDAPIRIRPIEAAQRGKPIEEPLDLRHSERRLIDLFLAISKSDGPTVAACFDFERLSQEMAPGFADLADDKKKETVKTMEKEMTKNLLGLKQMFPDPGLVEDAIAGGMKTTEKDGVARIQLFGQQTWKLFEVKEGPKKGRWFIFGIEQ